VESKTGVVTEFDEHRGVGAVEAEHGERYPFHCTAIVDGSRRIRVGAVVRFVVQPGLPGRWEARDITPERSGDVPS
jgi:cold shock protein